MKEVWLSTSYFGPVEYYHLLCQAETATIEAFEHYEKQSWRNRFRILSANGPIDLSIPIIKGRTHKQLISEVRIDYEENWQKNHYRSVESAYRHAPYYEYFIDDIRVMWQNRPEFLLEYNRLAMEIILRLMKSPVVIRYTGDYQKPGLYGPSDFRYLLHPKTKNKGTGYEPVPYHQVFSDRFGFVQGLSILDRLFNDFRI